MNGAKMRMLIWMSAKNWVKIKYMHKKLDIAHDKMMKYHL